MTEQRWLTSTEMQTWLTLIAVAMDLPPALDAQLHRDSGLSHFEYYILAMLSEAPERTMQMSELAELTNGTLSRLSHAVTKLENAGWVCREVSPRDARASLAILTDEGWEKVVATAPGHVERVRSLVFDQIDPADVEALGRILAPVRQALRERITGR